MDVRVSFCPFVRTCVVRPSVYNSFPDDNLSKHQWILTELGLCVDIIEIWFAITNGQNLSNLTELSAHHTSIFWFPDDS